MQGCPEQGQGVKPPKMGCCQVEGCMELSPALQGEARNRPLAQACSKLKTLYLNSLPFPFFPAWSDPAASPGPGAGPSTRTAGTGESSPEPLARGFCTPQSGPRAPCAPHPRAAPPLSPSSGATEGLHMAEPSSGTTEQRSPRSAFGVSPQGGEHGAPQVPSRPAGCCCHLRLPKIDFLLGFFSPTLSPMRSRAFSSSSCCWMVPSDLFSSFPRASAPAAGFRRSFSLITCPGSRGAQHPHGHTLGLGMGDSLSC